MNVSIVEFQSEYRDWVRILNEEWLRKYFYVESSDAVQLGDPETHILQKGGYICFARSEDGQIVGVGALMVAEPGVVELSKMAVTASFQGSGIGRKIAVHCLEKAKAMGYRKVILYSNRRLKSAIHVYENLGFREVPMVGKTYARADIKMELNLKPLQY